MFSGLRWHYCHSEVQSTEESQIKREWIATIARKIERGDSSHSTIGLGSEWHGCHSERSVSGMKNLLLNEQKIPHTACGGFGMTERDSSRTLGMTLDCHEERNAVKWKIPCQVLVILTTAGRKNLPQSERYCIRSLTYIRDDIITILRFKVPKNLR